MPVVAAEHVGSERPRIGRVDEDVDHPAEPDSASPDRQPQQLLSRETPHRSDVLPRYRTRKPRSAWPASSSNTSTSVT